MPSHIFHPPRNPKREIFRSTASVMMRNQVQKRSVMWPRSNTGIHPIFFGRQPGYSDSPLFSPVLGPTHGQPPSNSPSNMAGPTPTIMIDMGSEEACEEKRVNGWGD